jgi:hypothetical protein
VAKKWVKLEKSQRQEREEELEQDRPELDFTDHAANPVPDLEDKRYFGPSWDKADLKSGDHHRAAPKPERARFLNLLPLEKRGFTRYRQPTPGWAGRQEDEWPPFILRALAEVRQRNSPPPLVRQEGDERSSAAAMFNLIRRCEGLLPVEYRRRPAWLGYPTANLWLQLERSRLYYRSGRWLKPSEKLELKRMPKLKRVKINPLLTNEYLYGEPALKPGSSKRWSKRSVELRWSPPSQGIFLAAWEAKQREWKFDPVMTGWPEIKGSPHRVDAVTHNSKRKHDECLWWTRYYRATGGEIQICPPEKTAAQLQRRKVGRPPIGERAMTDAEYKRRSRAKQTLLPRERPEPGAVVPSTPFGPAVPGTSLILEIESMVSNFLEFELAEKYHQYLGEVLDRLAAAPASYILSREEFTIVAAAGVLGRRLLKPAAEFH